MPKAYVIVDMDITDPERYAAYRELAAAAVEVAGGPTPRWGWRDGSLRGRSCPHRTVILEFPDMQTARAWYDSPVISRRAPCTPGSSSRIVHCRRGRLNTTRRKPQGCWADLPDTSPWDPRQPPSRIPPRFVRPSSGEVASDVLPVQIIILRWRPDSISAADRSASSCGW